MPYALNVSRRLAEACLDLPNPPRELHEALDAFLTRVDHPLALGKTRCPTAEMSIGEIRERFQTGER